MREFAVLFISLALWRWNTIWVPGESPLLGALLPGGILPAAGKPSIALLDASACFQVFHVPRDWPLPG